MTKDEIEQRIIDLIRKQPLTLGKNVTAESTLREDLGLESLYSTFLIDDIRRDLSILIEDDEFEKIQTVGDLIELIEKKM